MITFSWLIPVWPLISFILLIFFMKNKERLASKVAILLTGLAFLQSVVALLHVLQQGPFKSEIHWFSIGGLKVTAGIWINELNGIMLALVAFISLLVQIYSIGYMAKEERQPVYFAYMSLFTSAMLGLVFSPNLLQMYLFWELVGLGSFLLIGFHFTREAAKRAAKKAFIMTRIGDVGFLIGIILLFLKTSTFELEGIFQAASNGELASSTITWAGFLIFVGAIGKSAQFPLFTWLPDAMEGPTPASALIHAATMVAAGVYVTATLYPLISESSFTLSVIAAVGIGTALLSAFVALTERDVKRVLAYSTVSQLGLMMLALGVLGAFASLFHLFTHAFFKALLFLAAGSVIVATGTQDLQKLGGLAKKIPKTAVLFLIGVLSISGFPFLSGFFSKEEILHAVYFSGNPVLLVATLLLTLLTACYMFRLFFLIFLGEKENTESGSGLTDAPGVLFYPMVILAFCSVIAGWFVGPFREWLVDWERYTVGGTAPFWLPVLSVAVFVLGVVLTYLIYGSKVIGRDWFSGRAPYTYRFIENSYYLDQLYRILFVKGWTYLGHVVKVFDRYILGAILWIVSGTVTIINWTHRRMQNGQTQSYGFVVLFGLVVIVALSLWTGGYFE